MVTPVLNISDVPQAIQLSLAPVFLLTGIAGLLNVMAGRLARIIDRGRVLTERADSQHPLLPHMAVELRELDRRRHFASSAITACTLSALLVCTVVMTLFVESLLDVPLRWLVSILFTLGTLALVVGLAYFLREVHLATTAVRFPIS